MAFSNVMVQVPATTANLGPGFDCLGVALTLHNRFNFKQKAEGTVAVEITVQGEEAKRVTTNKNNLIYRAFAHFYEHFGQTPPPIDIAIELGVPLSRGLGSSATAIVGGLLAANGLAGSPLDNEELLQIAIALEGHPDNVVPAFLGGCRLAVPTDQNWEICEIPWSRELVPVVAIPNFELSTREARSVLPTQITRDVAIFNIAHLGLLLRGIETGRGDWLRLGMQDQLHQPHRQKLIPGYTTVEAAALSSGAYGVAISGAGPTLLAIASAADAPAVAQEMRRAWESVGTAARVEVLGVSTQGAMLEVR